MTRFQRWQGRVRAAKREVHALYLAMKHPRTPWYAKTVALLVVAYALSPIDLIPDPIPVLGYLDDLVLIPLGVALVRCMVPAAVLDQCRRQAGEADRAIGVVGWVGAALIVLVWAATLLAVVYWGSRWIGRPLW